MIVKLRTNTQMTSRRSPATLAACDELDRQYSWTKRRTPSQSRRPLTEAQIYDKFADCLDVGASDIPADVLFKRLSAIQSMSARQITALQ